MMPMPLFHRFIGSIIDKVLILFIFVVGFVAVNGEGAASFRASAYFSIGILSPSDFSDTALDNLYIIETGYPLRYSEDKPADVIKRFDEINIEELVRSFDLTVTFSFILLNLIYFLLFETFLGASFGKKIMRGQIVDNLIGEKISFTDAFKRAVIGGTLMSMAVGMRFLLDVNYLIVIVLFFLILDYPVIIKKRSLIDILSNATYVDHKSCNANNRERKNDLVLVEKKKEEPIVNEGVLEVPLQYTNTKVQWRFYFSQILYKILMELRNNVKIKKALIYVYLVWLAVNIMALAYGMANPHEYHAKGGFTGGDFDCSPPPKEGVDTSAFYPFESYDIGNYDLSEFLVYTLAVPLCLFALVKLALLFVPLNTER